MPKSKKYEVSISRTLTLCTTVEVRATDEDEAEAKALTSLEESTLTWDIKDTNDWTEAGDDLTVDDIEEL